MKKYFQISNKVILIDNYLFPRMLYIEETSVSEWRGVKRGTIKENNYLFAKDLNNFLSAVNFETNEYFFSISVSKGIDTNMLDTIYVRRNIDSFWEQLQEGSIDGEKFLCMSK